MYDDLSDKKTSVARAKSKRRLNRKQKKQLREFRRNWSIKEDILSRVVGLENRLGRNPSIVDVLCIGLSFKEINSIDNELLWLYGPNWRYSIRIPVDERWKEEKMGVVAA
jgi:hypothetical protein